LDDFGPEAFQDEVFEWKHGPRSEVQEWANQREIELIAVHGGTLRDPSIYCKQTLNLTIGGKAITAFESHEAWIKLKWFKFQREMQLFVDERNTALVPREFKSASGYNLGFSLNCVRHNGTFWKGRPGEKERVAWLEALEGWSWSPTNDTWTEFQYEMQLFVEKKKTSLVPQDYRSTSGYRLGERVTKVRYRGDFLKDHRDAKQRKAWLESLPAWSWSPHEGAWKEFHHEMKLYVEEKDTALVPQVYKSASGYPLGSGLNSVRFNGTFWKGRPDEKERVAWLEALKGWSWNKLDSAWTKFQREMFLFVEEKNTASVPSSYKATSGYPLGCTVSNVRQGQYWKGKDDEAERVAWLEALPGWKWPKKRKKS
jgi:hypothetical protein